MQQVDLRRWRHCDSAAPGASIIFETRGLLIYPAGRVGGNEQYLAQNHRHIASLQHQECVIFIERSTRATTQEDPPEVRIEQLGALFAAAGPAIGFTRFEVYTMNSARWHQPLPELR
jgi:hypothetical protein